jgi:hypothetical protein
MTELFKLLLIFGAAYVAVVLLQRWLKRRKRGGNQGALEVLPYRRKDYLLTQAERSFYEVLNTALADTGWVIFAKVRLLDLLWMPHGTANAQSHRNRVMSKHVDFVLCDRQTIGPRLVIELDDASHEAESRRQRDQFDQVMEAAQLPLLHIIARRTYSSRELRRLIEERLAGTERPRAANAVGINDDR